MSVVSVAPAEEEEGNSDAASDDPQNLDGFDLEKPSMAEKAAAMAKKMAAGATGTMVGRAAKAKAKKEKEKGAPAEEDLKGQATIYLKILTDEKILSLVTSGQDFVNAFNLVRKIEVVDYEYAQDFKIKIEKKQALRSFSKIVSMAARRAGGLPPRTCATKAALSPAGLPTAPGW